MEPVPTPEWADDLLRRNWSDLSPDDQTALVADHERSQLRKIASGLRHTESADSVGTKPAGMFTCDGLNDMKWHAERFEEPWNGWATPVVTRETLANLLEDMRQHSGSALGVINRSGVVTLFHDEADGGNQTVHPDHDGLYHLYEFGWTFLERT